ncbi:MAG: Adenine permease AdeP [Chlamydiales bacterium]|nr:Adenine permease AdeP [Chlamydiales bacterium]MCH9619906.1 Adenine permease AdeP [Chlamydiales bacterium]MCH9622667.1 Adenine permease AdeP [Chlamydiales bacterium]
MLVSKKKYPRLDSFFQLEERKTTVSREVIGGLTTFLTMAYAFVIISAMLGESGLDKGGVMTATLLTAIFGTFYVALFSNYPIAVAPGLILVAYVSHNLIGKNGLNWEVALGIVFLEGFILLCLNILKIREWIIHTIPEPLRLGTTAGLGLFLALIGFKHVVEATPLIYGLAGLGLIVTALLMFYRIPGAFFLGILLIWFLGFLTGIVDWGGIVSFPHSLAPTLFKLKIQSAFHLDYLGLIISIVLMSLFESTGAVLALGEKAGLVEERGKTCYLPSVSRLFYCDSTSSMMASFLGTTSAKFYLESAAGIGAGGRTGLTALVTAIAFCSLFFFFPLLTSIPLFATTPALVIIGGSMVVMIKGLKWSDPTDWIPAVLTLIFIPATLNIAAGIGVGYVTYSVLKLVTKKQNQVHGFSWIIAALFFVWFLFSLNFRGLAW